MMPVESARAEVVHGLQPAHAEAKGREPGRVTLTSRARLGCIVAAAVVLLYTVLLAVFSSTAFPHSYTFHSHAPYLMDKPVGEDGLYMLTVARNIASTGHILYNRGLETTGIQPLATFVFAAIDTVVHALGGGSFALIRSVLVFGACLFIFFAWQMSEVAARAAPASLRRAVFLIAFFLVLFDYILFRLFTYGLETGIYLCALALCVRLTQTILAKGGATTRDAVWLGCAAGIAAEARIDFGLLFGCLLLMLLAKRLLSPGRLIVSGLLALLIVSPWLLFVHHVTHSWMPTSGKAESTLVTSATLWPRLLVMLSVVAGHVAPWTYGGNNPLTAVVAVVSAAALLALFISPLGRRTRAESTVAWKTAELWAPGLLLLLVTYVVYFNSQHFYYRYAAPMFVVTLPLVAGMLAQIAWVRRHLALAGTVLAATFAVWTYGSLHTEHLANGQTVAAGYIREYYPEAHVGAFQSGVMGYFDPNVENLDGKLNLGAWNAARHHRLPAFIDREGINVLIDWPSLIKANLPQSYLSAEWQSCPVPLTGTESICLVRKHASVAEGRGQGE